MRGSTLIDLAAGPFYVRTWLAAELDCRPEELALLQRPAVSGDVGVYQLGEGQIGVFFTRTHAPGANTPSSWVLKTQVSPGTFAATEIEVVRTLVW